jgi:hypothetical protein
VSAARRARAGALAAALGLAALTAACGDGSSPAGSGATSSTTASPSASSATSAAAAPTSFTDATACATFGDRGVETRLVDVYADDAASAALVQEYEGAPAFQEALRQTVELLRSSDGELEGDFLATACADQPTG